MVHPQFEMLESRQLLSGSTCDGSDHGSMTAAFDAATAHTARPLGYTYPDPGGGGGAGGGTGGSQSGSRDYAAKLRGKSEVPARTTTAKGNATFLIARDGKSIRFQIKVSNLHNVVAAHLHLGSSNINGPIVAHLYGPESPGGGPRSGKLGTGTLKARHLEGSLEGKALKKLINAIKAGNVYVNVHTDDGNGSSDTGAGDFASGEIRGQVRRA